MVVCVAVAGEDAAGLGVWGQYVPSFTCTQADTYTAVVLLNRTHFRSIKATDLDERANMAASG